MKNYRRVVTTMILTVLLSAGCGAAENAEEKAPVETVEEEAGTPASEKAAETSSVEDRAETSMSGEAAENLVPDPTNLIYLEEYQIKDVYGDKKEYPLYAPKDGINNDGYFYFDDHGVTFTASVYSGGSWEELQMYLETSVNLKVEGWRNEQECSEVGVGETLEKGDDRYLFLTAKAKDYNGIPYQRRLLVYMSVRDGNVGVFWDMELREYGQDEETAPLIQEVARCYGLNLSEFDMEDGEWAQQNAQREADRQDVYEPEEGDPVLEKVDGYQYLGMLTLTLDEEENVTCPVLAPMGWNTTADDHRVSTTIHGVSVRLSGYEIGTVNYQAMAQKEAEGDLKLRSDPEEGNRNVQISEIMPMTGQEAAVYYIIEYEEQDYGSEEYHKRADVTCIIQVNEKCFVTAKISLKSGEYDSSTNSLIKELETAYGLDLSAWYAGE